MTPLLEELSLRHYPKPPTTSARIESFERHMGWRLDADLRAFYLHCDGADLFDRVEPAFRFYPLAEIRRARVAIFQEDTDEWGPASWYALGEVRDTNYILIDISQQGGPYPIRDGYREMFPRPEYCRQLANSFSDFLTGALKSNGMWFWLRE
jgi:hypothetical protein